MNNNKKRFTPFSKKNVNYARWEAYIFSVILIIMVWCNKDVTAISILLSLAWGGYKSLQCFYIWMCKHEHIEELKQGRLLNDLDITDLNFESEKLSTEDLNFEDTMG